MNRFHLWAGERYYPARALGDYVGAFETEGDALSAAANESCDWWSIVQMMDDGTLVEVDSGNRK